ncbi:bifunctional methylenetetrahydrofolate dehydrogenase/methenyltetrahydrofolate cyclohydrolase FolD [Leptolinea tardivitalis]|uniref:Bifunctional protein FolD n=1 Tax=Leptolinea tardivitalis TaxID=229920 RepID=A0A0P6XH82_9CHLR|nr:bifunctional methylenetetrahydrofolate dehydrogenase/methenyltetrahydrofolate cyclohydrolase FolD [Leptolinea tardivitalis]KPL74776.1 methenyltetrahydrofolate cyclohydrolase [Leptolinea tardivitalis]GAP22850.1 5,10-methylene-tetrahydrofolate dehydrogenase [Leptolinea tardivitalis]
MPATIISGTEIAKQIRADVAKEVAERVQAGKPKPGLATVLVGDDPASHDYVRSKQKACAEVGINSFGYELPASTSQQELESLVKKLNDDPQVNGILVQLPLPKGFDEESVLSSIRLEKDVDGFHPINIGRLAQKGREPLFVPCTPAGCMFMLEKYLPKIEGKNAVVLGRSNIVGMPVALLLIRANATVTICHSKSSDLPGIIRQADILVTAVGRPEMVRGDWIKPGAVIIDVGINHVDDPSRPKGYRVVGDVNFKEAVEVAGAITPVPGGVGPMTIAMLLKSTLTASKMANG